MAENLQRNHFPKGSYQAYKSMLNQFSSAPQTCGKPTAANLPIASNENVKTLETRPILKRPNKTSLPSVENEVSKELELTIEALLAMTNGDLDMLDAGVYKQFLKILKKENEETLAVDANNNDEKTKCIAQEENVEAQKHQLIQSMKVHLERYHQHE